MAGFSIKIDRNVLQAEVEAIIGRKPRYLLEPALAAAEEVFPEVLDKVLQEFDNHKVTQELEAGPDIDGSILPLGNLYSFIGFPRGFEPAHKLRGILEDGIKLNHEPTYNRRLKKYYFKIDRPTPDDIADETSGDLPWELNDSWVNAIEGGLSNFGQYLFLHGVSLPGSYSGPALQVKKTINAGDFGGTPYLSDIWKFMEQSLSKSAN